MRQIVIISGKGGTGKTSIAAAVIHTASQQSKVVSADCDVDASDLHLILQPEIKQKNVFQAGFKAQIDKDRCTVCRECIKVCRFDAIFYKQNFCTIEPFLCEGCGLCQISCNEKAITIAQETAGEWYISDCRYGNMVHAMLYPGSENSGKLVTMVRHQAKLISEDTNAEYIIIDGPPGIGCPVIASITGTDLALAVIEPTVSGIHDFERIQKLCNHFKVKILVCINKYDINIDITHNIEDYCSKNNVPVVMKLAFSDKFLYSQIQNRSIIEFDNSYSSTFSLLWSNINYD
ncbi:MAG: ATP-binding protein [Candidatus Hydrogenedentota bacterium]